MTKTLKFKTGELLKWFDLPDEMEKGLKEKK